jgi:hypothetical protein
MTASCIYQGTIRHRRVQPARQFSHGLALAYLDLDELPSLLGGRLVSPRPGPLRFRRRDYLGDPSTPLADAVRERVAELSGAAPAGPIRLLTQLCSWGLCFNPVSFYYCLDQAGQRVRSVLVEVTNTPWAERHAYLLQAGGDDSSVLVGGFAKELHVSPFMGMDHVYEARATPPGATLSVHIESHRAGISVFDATLAMERHALTRASAARMIARYPIATARVLALIYGHAVGLKLAGARVHPHPEAASR